MSNKLEQQLRDINVGLRGTVECDVATSYNGESGIVENIVIQSQRKNTPTGVDFVIKLDNGKRTTLKQQHFKLFK